MVLIKSGHIYTELCIQSNTQGEYHSVAPGWILSSPPWLPLGYIHTQQCLVGTTCSWWTGGKHQIQKRTQKEHRVQIQCFNPESSVLQDSKISYGKEVSCSWHKSSAPNVLIPESLCLVPLPEFIWQLQSTHKQEWATETRCKHMRY